MLFSNSVFLFLFLPGVLFVYYVILRKSHTWQNVFLAFSSLFFYAWGEPYFVLIMLGSIACNWWFAILVDRKRENNTRSRIIIASMLVVNLGIMFIFKYLMFTLENINMLFNSSIVIPTIALPIGLSFFTFQSISYVVDVYRGNGEVQKNPLNVVLYISFFPQLIAGPIVRYQTVAEQIKNRKETVADFSEGCRRFILGLSKKVLLSNNLALIADAAFNESEMTVLLAWVGAIAYTLQIYYDFSGYSDMAIGLGKMFGFHFLENFDYPYISKSISEFWRRWHISLGSWFRDYVYFPLGGSRVEKKSRLIFNLFVVWFLTGIWHGANWTFIVWGLMYFMLILIEKVTGFEEKIGIFGHVYSMLFVIIGWVIFRAENISQAIWYIKNMFIIQTECNLFDEIAIYYLVDNWIYFALGTLFAIPISNKLKVYLDKPIGTYVYSGVVICLFILSIIHIVKGSYNPFIYFNF